MRKLLSTLALPVVVAGALFASVPASAAVAGTTTFNFSGSCTDCTGTGTGELVLSGYTPGTIFGQSNFVSFHYDGTDLFPAFTITAADTFFVSGQINPPLPAPEDFEVFSNSVFFVSANDGTWRVGNESEIADYGTNGIYSGTPATAVPEPFSLTLMLSGIAGTALLARRRNG